MEKFRWLNEESQYFLEQGYLQPGQSVEERVWQIALRAEELMRTTNPGRAEGFATKLFYIVERGWLSLSSPVWSNFGVDGVLPISCNGVYVDDSIPDILMKAAEVGMMTKLGAGTSAYLGAIRSSGSEISTGGKADGPVVFARLFDVCTEIISQGNVRRGHCAVFLDIEHPDCNRFLKMRDIGDEIKNLSFGVCVSDAWMNKVIKGDQQARELWVKVIKKRFESGFPYIFFTDTVNREKPPVLADSPIYATNMCSEICLPSDKDTSFVCCLSSLNLELWDEWGSDALTAPTVVQVALDFLDTVMEEYIQKTASMPLMKNAHNFSKKYRALGLGALGWHSLLQKKNLPFESFEAKLLNTKIFKWIKEQGHAEHRPNATLFAIAPTTSSSFILGQVSPSIEPLNSNYFTKDLAKGKFTYKNPYLMAKLEAAGLNTDETWRSILLKGGSVQHLDFLDEHTKNVFKTFGEINQMDIVIQASQRQKFIDQSQSLNLMFSPDESLKTVNGVLVEAWRLGVKTVYYHRSSNPSQLLARKLKEGECTSCQG